MRSFAHFHNILQCELIVYSAAVLTWAVRQAFGSLGKPEVNGNREAGGRIPLGNAHPRESKGKKLLDRRAGWFGECTHASPSIGYELEAHGSGTDHK